jgi:hypothetical protein
LQLVVIREHGRMGIYIVRSRYQAMTIEDMTESEDLVCAVVIRTVYRFTKIDGAGGYSRT